MTPSSTPTPATRSVLNGLARLHVEKAVGCWALSSSSGVRARRPCAPCLRVGDELCCLRNRARLGAGRDPSGKGVRNGTRGVVQAIDCQSREVTLATSDGRMLRLPAEYVRRSTDYGYAWTLHKGQGQTVGQAPRSDAGEVARRRGRAFVFGAEGLSAEAALVAASRATDSTELFVLTEPTRRRAPAMGTRSWAGRGAAASSSDSPSTSSRPERRSPVSPELPGRRSATSATRSFR